MFKRTSSFSPPYLSEAGASSNIQQEADHRYLPEEERDSIYGQLIEFYSLVFHCIQIIRLTDYRCAPVSPISSSKFDILLFYKVM
jgi:hypothetical protein